jgi:hypothetical protein
VLPVYLDGDVEPEDYDEDISELGESDKLGEEGDERDCGCDRMTGASADLTTMPRNAITNRKTEKTRTKRANH